MQDPPLDPDLNKQPYVEPPSEGADLDVPNRERSGRSNSFDLRKPPSAFEAAFSAPEEPGTDEDGFVEYDDGEPGFGQDVTQPQRPSETQPRSRMLEATKADQQGGAKPGQQTSAPVASLNPTRPTNPGVSKGIPQPGTQPPGTIRNQATIPSGKVATQGLKTGVRHAEEKALQNVGQKVGGKLAAKIVGGTAGGPIGTAIAVLSSAKDVWDLFRQTSFGKYVIMGVLALILCGMVLMLMLGLSLFGTLSNFGAAIRGGLRLMPIDVQANSNDRFTAAVAAQERGITLQSSIETMDASRVKIAQILDRNTLGLSAAQISEARQLLTEMHNTRIQMQLPNSAPSAEQQAKLRQDYRNQYNKLYTIVFPGTAAAQSRIKGLIANGTFRFDTAAGRRDLELTNTPVDPKLLELVAGLGEFAASKDMVIRITAVKSDHKKFTSSGRVSDHHYGKGIDIAEITPKKKVLDPNFTEPLLQYVYDNRQKYNVSDLFWDGAIKGRSAPLNMDNGRPAPGLIVGGHLNHIHISVK